MSEKSLRYVLLGAGGMGGGHVSNLSKVPGVEIAGFQDVAKPTLEKWKQKYPHARTDTDAASLLAAVKPDFAVVASSNQAHCSLTMAALEAGCHVLCEKPMAMTVGEAERMEKARAAGGRVGAINFSYRCVVAFRFARELIKAGELGRLQRVNVVYLQSFLGAGETPWTWRNDVSVAGFGALGDLGSHMIDGATFVTGLSPKRVVGIAKTLVPDKPDQQGVRRPVTSDTNASFIVEYDSGAIGTFETSQTVPGYGNYFRIEVSGDRGVLRVLSEDNDGLTLLAGPTISRYPTWGREAFPRVSVPTGFAAVNQTNNMELFVRAVRGESVEYPTFADGLNAQRVLNGIVESMNRGGWVDVG